MGWLALLLNWLRGRKQGDETGQHLRDSAQYLREIRAIRRIQREGRRRRKGDQ